MEAGHLVEDGRRDVGTARRHLVALGAADDVLEEEREPARLRFDLGHVGEGDTGVDPGRHLTVEADLDFVGPQGEAGAPALLVGRGELAHDGAGPAGRSLVGIAEREAGGVGHLARADGLGREVVDPAPGGTAPAWTSASVSHSGRDVGRGVEQGDRAHGGTRLMGSAGVRLAAVRRAEIRHASSTVSDHCSGPGQAVAATVGRAGGWRRTELRVPHTARAKAQAV